MKTNETSYDAIPYPSIPFPETHPNRLSAIARIFGLEAPDPASCRVLELGCSMGGNLIAISQVHPGARCLGIDASSHQIAEGWKTIDALGLKNVRLRHADILEVGDDIGEFDYIISHGVYSWVPSRVQDKMLEICHRHLAPNGVAYISYNTYPGWHIRGIVRDMMFYRGMQFSDADARLAQAKSLVEFVAHASGKSETPYQQLLQGEFKQLGKMNDYYLHHEYLEDHNQPLYFHEFAKRLAVNGLQYLGEAEFSTMVSSNFAPDVAKTLHEMGAHDILQMEQYMDFVRCRFFRKTLLCRKSIRLNRAIDAGIVKGLMLGSNATTTSDELVLDPSERVTFRAPGGGMLTCKLPVTKLALRMLQQRWPMPVAFPELFELSIAEAARQGHPADGAATEDILAADLLTGMGAGVVEWRTAPVPYAVEVGERPWAPPLARLQAAQDYRAANLRGELGTLDEIHRQTLKLLDGTRDFSALIDSLVTALKAGEFVLYPDNDRTPIKEEAKMRELLNAAIRKVLENLAKQAYLAPCAP
jgi:methyltransferase-like protein/SAM-dependent methyltransferase